MPRILSRYVCRCIAPCSGGLCCLAVALTTDGHRLRDVFNEAPRMRVERNSKYCATFEVGCPKDGVLYTMQPFTI